MIESPANKYEPHIGCAGWSIAAAHAPLFGGGDSVLARYATRFNAVEINSSFYRPHQRKTYQRWADSVPAAFRFSVKLPRTITHEQRLQGSGPALDRFLDEVEGLGAKLGGILVQLPPSLVFDARAANIFFAVLRRRFSQPVACEPRHPSWFTVAADKLWSRHEVSRVVADPAVCADAAVAAGAGPWRYWRWHGSPRIYYSAYDDAALKRLAGDMLAAAAGNKIPWAVFDNTALRHATVDAARLQSLLSDAGRS